MPRHVQLTLFSLEYYISLSGGALITHYQGIANITPPSSSFRLILSERLHFFKISTNSWIPGYKTSNFFGRFAPTDFRCFALNNTQKPDFWGALRAQKSQNLGASRQWLYFFKISDKSFGTWVIRRGGFYWQYPGTTNVLAVYIMRNLKTPAQIRYVCFVDRQLVPVYPRQGGRLPRRGRYPSGARHQVVP